MRAFIPPHGLAYNQGFAYGTLSLTNLDVAQLVRQATADLGTVPLDLREH
jgi:hypothetical protein